MGSLAERMHEPPSLFRYRLATKILVLAMTAAFGGCHAPRMLAPENTDRFYPAASVRLGEGGTVILHFAVGPDGKARQPIRHDEPVIVGQYDPRDTRGALRLIEGAENYIRASTFDARGVRKRELTASFVFEVKPCGTLTHSPVHDYAISLCRERPPPTPMIQPHCRIIDGLIRC